MARKYFDTPISPNGIEHFGGPLDGSIYENREDIPVMRVYRSHKYILSVRGYFLVYEYDGAATVEDMRVGDPVFGVGWLWDKACLEKAAAEAAKYSPQNIQGFPAKQIPSDIWRSGDDIPCLFPNHFERTNDREHFSWITLATGLAVLSTAIALLYFDWLLRYVEQG